MTTKYAGDSSTEKKKYTYDAKGFLKSISDNDGSQTYKNTVKSGRLTKKSGDSGTYTLKSKKVSVPASFADQVKAQQSYLVNFLTEKWYTFDYPVWY